MNMNFKKVPEMNAIEVTDSGIRVGAAVTLSQMEDVFKTELEVRPTHQTRVLKAMVEMLQWFAGKQIRNVAALGGETKCQP